MKRNPGYYWVKINKASDWEPVYFDGNKWHYETYGLSDGDFFSIHEVVINPPLQ